MMKYIKNLIQEDIFIKKLPLDATKISFNNQIDEIHINK